MEHSTNKTMTYTKLSDKVIAVIQRQIKHEADNANLYLSMVNYCKDKSIRGGEALFHKQYEGELDHQKIFTNYLIDKKVCVNTPTITGFEAKYECLIDMLCKALEREKGTTDMIKQLADTASTERDYWTFELALTMLKEQQEEESLFITWLDRYEMLKDCPSGKFLLDQELEEKYK